MRTIALTAAALLVTAGAAFAGSDNFDAYAGSSPYAASAKVDTLPTASIRQHDATLQWLNGDRQPSADKAAQAAIDYRVNNFGNR